MFKWTELDDVRVKYSRIVIHNNNNLKLNTNEYEMIRISNANYYDIWFENKEKWN